MCACTSTKSSHYFVCEIITFTFGVSAHQREKALVVTVCWATFQSTGTIKPCESWLDINIIITLIIIVIRTHYLSTWINHSGTLSHWIWYSHVRYFSRYLLSHDVSFSQLLLCNSRNAFSYCLALHCSMIARFIPSLCKLAFNIVCLGLYFFLSCFLRVRVG